MDSAVEHLCNRMNVLAQMTGTVFTRDEFFRGWNYDPDSVLRKQFSEVLDEEGTELKKQPERREAPLRRLSSKSGAEEIKKEVKDE